MSLPAPGMLVAVALALACGAAPPSPATPTPTPTPTTPVAPQPAPLRAVAPGPELVGLCDASAAVAVGRWLVVADDERNVLRVFDTAADAKPVGAIDLAALSPLFRGPEADLEGMAVARTDPDGAVVVWVTGSHDSGKGTERQPNRQRLFALRLAPTDAGVDAALVAGPITGLIDAGGEASQLAGIVGETVGRTSKDPAGLSIEGLAAGPADSLLFGFRTPIHAGKALVERLDNPDAFATGAAPTFTGPRWLDLGGRGIRSMDRDDDGAMLIVAGPPDGGDGDPAFALYRWSGFDDGAAPVDARVGFGKLRPEALVRVGQDWWVLSDDGTVDLRSAAGAKAECKKLPEAERRARTARLP